ncbi:hypothetical protein BO78DRAFT_400438 [Aspergillus sclerotiicarbonarius CBS 121057]|uniref:Uncharacterized protein n=1 Tax=Aspergillus sclerotiicarbonarius (strain CBS 121057 / IBT 28362) TaxID=1448318 RepID=A0A319DXJ9_ASPSB|nr:hypothetical protein BO78DRAFT_400438 [Aspergillus sclerotiicarbonarius CBS 121057]
MGRLSNSNPPVEEAQALLSHENVEHNDAPPPYAEYLDYASSSAPTLDTIPVRVRLDDSAYILAGSATNIQSDTLPPSTSTTLAPIFSHDRAALFHEIHRQMTLPPRPLLGIQGSHIESTGSRWRRWRRSRWRSRRTTVIDFDLTLDLAETIFAGPTDNKSIKVLRESTTHNPRPLHRTLPSTAEYDYTALDSCEAGMSPHPEDHTMASNIDNELKRWCERFCSDPSPLKSFTIHRHIPNLDTEVSILRNRLTSHLRALNYRGSLHFSVSIAHRTLTIYSPHWINRLRTMTEAEAEEASPWWIVCLLFLLSMALCPIVWLLERRYELVYEQGHRPSIAVPSPLTVGCTNATATTTSPYSISSEANSEEIASALGNFWGPAVQQAAWNWRQQQRQEGTGRRKRRTILTRQNAERVQGLTTTQILRRQRNGERGQGLWIPGEESSPGTIGLVDRVAGRVREVIEDTAVAWRVWIGWGGHS